jgi:hypothetical protein
MLRRLLAHLRPLAIGVVVLVLSAGAVLAGQPRDPADGRGVGSEAAGRTVPVGGTPTVQNDEDETSEAEEAEQETEGENCATDPSSLSDEELAALRHGQIVCWAAFQETPDGYDSHGAWVAEWARSGKDHPAPNDHAASGLSHRP